VDEKYRLAKIDDMETHRILQRKTESVKPDRFTDGRMSTEPATDSI
jgi:hypothetical protein